MMPLSLSCHAIVTPGFCELHSQRKASDLSMLNALDANAYHRWARAADPDAELCLNEWGILDDDKLPTFMRRVKDLQTTGAPITCIGVQGHLRNNWNLNDLHNK